MFVIYTISFNIFTQLCVQRIGQSYKDVGVPNKMLIEGQRSTAVKGTKIFKNMSERESQFGAAIEVFANVRCREKDKIRESTPTSD